MDRPLYAITVVGDPGRVLGLLGHLANDMTGLESVSCYQWHPEEAEPLTEEPAPALATCYICQGGIQWDDRRREWFHYKGLAGSPHSATPYGPSDG